MGDIADMYDEWPHEDQDEDCMPFITCKYCGCDFLEWRDVEGQWRLFDMCGKLHNCHVSLSADELAKVWK